jgi:hypothetical protein
VTDLLDVNLLIALIDPTHVGHSAAAKLEALQRGDSRGAAHSARSCESRLDSKITTIH